MNIIDLKEKGVFRKEGCGMAIFTNERYLQMNRVCLEIGREVPQHNANSNVALTVVYGEGTFHSGNNEMGQMGPGKLFHVTSQSSMCIKNGPRERYVFLVIKTPYPRRCKKLS